MRLILAKKAQQPLPLSLLGGDQDVLVIFDDRLHAGLSADMGDG